MFWKLMNGIGAFVFLAYAIFHAVMFAENNDPAHAAAFAALFILAKLLAKDARLE